MTDRDDDEHTAGPPASRPIEDIGRFDRRPHRVRRFRKTFTAIAIVLMPIYIYRGFITDTLVERLINLAVIWIVLGLFALIDYKFRD